MTDAEILQYVYSQIGGERKSGVLKPILLAIAELAYDDLADYLIKSEPDKAKKLITSVANQAWLNSEFSAPSDMLLNNQKAVVRLDIGGDICYQLKDRDKLDFLTGTTAEEVSKNYCALEGKTFYIRVAGGATTSGNDLNLRYYKTPVAADIDDELRKPFLELLMQRVLLHIQVDKSDEQR